MTPALVRAVARALVGVLLFAQLAIAAYACQKLMPTGSSAPPAAAILGAMSDGSTDRDGMGGAMQGAQPNLCAEHCRYGQQSDQAVTLAAPVPGPALLPHLAPFAPDPTLLPRPATATPGALAAASPPHATLHCCLRI